MAPNVRTVLLVAGAAGVGVLAWWLLYGQDRGGDLLDTLADAVVELTSSDEARLEQLEPTTQDRARALIQALANEGIDVQVGQTLRTPAQEKAVIDAGKSAVTTHSWHELGRALDLYPIDPDTGSADLAGARVDLFQRMHQLAAALGFRGIAFNDDGSKRYITNSKGKRIWDGGHLEWRDPYGSISEAVAAEGANYGIA